MSNTLDNSRPENGRTSLLCIDLNIDPDLGDGVDSERIRQAVVQAAAFRGCTEGQIGIRLTDDTNIHELNRRHLGHDYETDVISFGYELAPPFVEGELVASVETATRRAGELGWPVGNELLLYVVHGTLHIVGMDDGEADQRAEMRAAEREILMRLGVDQIVRFGADGSSGDAAEESS